MSIFDKVKSLLGEHGTKAEELAKQGVDQAARKAKEKTGGKYDEHIDTAAAKAREMTDRIDGQSDPAQAPGRTGPHGAHDDASAASGHGDPYGGTGPSGTPGGNVPHRAPDDEPPPPSTGRPDAP
ncbi:antitoxin [Streptosporangium carneum]|uniref:Antitoxin n=1 Tax=Streptosporangium carneum TaxID=47481 RepID=A0A9W6I011_9ACTN|nr:antitoxin [Streptosporangium carneum]GLK09510.1 hypothetical protein GCM10017600_29160 [Streptosporangium carneum]